MMKNKQELIDEKQYAYDTQKQSLLLSSLLENEFILKEEEKNLMNGQIWHLIL
jgi:hypothetical protein